MKVAPPTMAKSRILIDLAGVCVWVLLSGGLIMFNKFILSTYGFPFPIALTLFHQVYCFGCASMLIRVFRAVDTPDITRDVLIEKFLPIAALFMASLWFSNAAYVYLSVSFIQILKAFMPASVYLHGICYGVEGDFSLKKIVVLLIISFGVATASLGEINFSWIGFTFQALGIAAESNRLLLSQKLLQGASFKLNPITTLYYVSPLSASFLSIAWLVLESSDMLGMRIVPCTVAPPADLVRMAGFCFETEVPGGSIGLDHLSSAHIRYKALPTVVHVMLFMANGTVAFALNSVVYFVISRTSALTMNIAGPVKDVLLIVLSALIFRAPVTLQQYIGFAIAFGGIAKYNYDKLKASGKL